MKAKLWINKGRKLIWHNKLKRHVTESYVYRKITLKGRKNKTIYKKEE